MQGGAWTRCLAIPEYQMTRRPDWPARLEAYLLRHASEKFKYGRSDCCLFVCDVLETMTGVDPAASFRGNYSSSKGAAGQIRAFCGRPSLKVLVEKICEQLGMPKIAPGLARRGDIALIKRPRDYSVGIVGLDGRTVLVLARSGIVKVPLSAAESAFRV